MGSHSFVNLPPFATITTTITLVEELLLTAGFLPIEGKLVVVGQLDLQAAYRNSVSYKM